MELLVPKISTTYVVLCENTDGRTYEYGSYNNRHFAEAARRDIIDAQIQIHQRNCYVEPPIAYVTILAKQTIEQYTEKDLCSVKVAIAEAAVKGVPE